MILRVLYLLRFGNFDKFEKICKDMKTLIWLEIGFGSRSRNEFTFSLVYPKCTKRIVNVGATNLSSKFFKNDLLNENSKPVKIRSIHSTYEVLWFHWCVLNCTRIRNTLQGIGGKLAGIGTRNVIREVASTGKMTQKGISNRNRLAKNFLEERYQEYSNGKMEKSSYKVH